MDAVHGKVTWARMQRSLTYMHLLVLQTNYLILGYNQSLKNTNRSYYDTLLVRETNT